MLFDTFEEALEYVLYDKSIYEGKTRVEFIEVGDKIKVVPCK